MNTFVLYSFHFVDTSSRLKILLPEEQKTIPSELKENPDISPPDNPLTGRQL
jgi:hypothetical protein